MYSPPRTLDCTQSCLHGWAEPVSKVNRISIRARRWPHNSPFEEESSRLSEEERAAMEESPLLVSSAQEVAFEFLDAPKLIVGTDFGFSSLRDQGDRDPNLRGRPGVIQPVSDEEHFVCLRTESAHRHSQLLRALQGILACEADGEEPSKPELPEDPFASPPPLHGNKRETGAPGQLREGFLDPLDE